MLGQRAELNVLYGLTKVPQWCAMCGDYHAAGFPPSGGLRGALPKIQIDKWLSLFSKKMTNVASYIFRKGGYNSTMLNDKPIKDLREELYGFFEEGLQSGLSLESNVIPPAMAKSLKENLFIFSACKTETELRTLGDLLRNPDGTIKPRAQFMRETTELYKTYNQNYLEAEYNFAVASSQMAAKWAKFAEAGDRFDLQYRTASDDHVRESHVKLHNVTLPFSDDFWNDFFPPNGWRCRCVVVQVRKGKHPLSDSKKAIADGKAATTLTNKDGVNKLAIFRYNPGKQAVIFPPHHPYMQEKERIAAIVKDKEAGLTIAYESANGATVKAHDNADPKDFANNITQAKKLADNGDNVIIREHNGVIGKNPELEIEGRMADFKGTDKRTVSGINAVRNAFRTSKQQGIDFIVFVMPDKFYEREIIAAKLAGEFGSTEKINDVWMLFDNNKVAKLKKGMSKQEIYNLLP